MSPPISWPAGVIYTPIGDKCPVDLFQSLTPEEEVDALLLGCGDLRNIMFSFFIRQKALIQPSIDITCCDIEPAILARNIVILTLIVDHDLQLIKDDLWKITFCFYLDQSPYNLLVEQCDKLLEHSDSLEAWGLSHYAPFLSFCTTDTLKRVRQQWLLCVQSASLSLSQRCQMVENIETRLAPFAHALQSGIPMSSYRSAGPLFADAMPILGMSPELYWKNSAFNDRHDGAINPTLYFSSNPGVRINLTSHPLNAFPSSQAFISLISSKERSLVTNAEKQLELIMEDLRGQFHDWCTATRLILLSSSSIRRTKIRFFAGDAIAFCTALHTYSLGSSLPGQFVKSWTNVRIELDGDDYSSLGLYPAPAFFNVIDTSDLGDHLGLLNIIIASTPLLSRTPCATLYTDNLLQRTELEQGFLTKLCMEPAIFQVISGISPAAAYSDYSTRSSIHEIILQQALGPECVAQKHHERIAWKDVSAIDSSSSDNGGEANITGKAPPVFDPFALAKVFRSTYHFMFANEDPSFRAMKLASEGPLSLETHHYTRSSFATLLLMVRKRLTGVDWDNVMRHFISEVEKSAGLSMGMNHFQDLCCQLHVLGLIDLKVFLQQWSPSLNQDSSLGRFSGWSAKPAIVRVVMVVPRRRLFPVDDILSSAGVTPSFQCDVTGAGGSRSVFSSLNVCFGRIISGPTSAGHGPVLLEEDFSGKEGRSDLIISFWIPMHLLLGREPMATSFAFCLYPTPVTSSLLVNKLGPSLRLFSAHVNDKTHLYFSREEPFTSVFHPLSSPSQSPTSPRSPSSGTQHPVKISLTDDFGQIASFTARIDLVDRRQQSALRNGAKISHEQISPCRIAVRFARYTLTYVFPYPVRREGVTLRIARKPNSPFIEVIAPIRNLTEFPRCDDTLHHFPVIFTGTNHLAPWDMHRIVFDSLPVLDLSLQRRTSSFNWYEVHLKSMFSAGESWLFQSHAFQSNPDSYTVLPTLKESLYVFFTHVAGLRFSRRTTVFALHNSVSGECYTLIFINKVHLDTSSHTIVADTFLLPITPALKNVPRVQEALRRITAASGSWGGGVVTSPKETAAWKRLMPLLVERCRQWSHFETCEYMNAQGRIVPPLSYKVNESPLCSCGQGRDTSEFLKHHGQWLALTPYVTRAAISPIFVVSYLRDAGLGGIAPFPSVYNAPVVVPNVAEPVYAKSGTRDAKSIRRRRFGRWVVILVAFWLLKRWLRL